MKKTYFNEYEYKNTKQRISIEYFRDSNERLNPWDITNFISRISTYMYKMDLINTIALAINCGIPPKDIFILDKAYKINGRYENISSLQLNTLDINKIFSIGKPISMEPNIAIKELSYLFEVLYKTNQILYKHGKKRISKFKRLDAYNVLYNEGIIQAFDYVVVIGLLKIDEEERQKAYRKIQKIQKQF